MKSKLNIRQRKFIGNLFQGMSQKKAYTEAGYGKRSADMGSSRLIRNDKIKQEIQRLLTDLDSRNRIRLGRISETALAKLLNIINDDEAKDSVKLDAIKDALDRAGLKPVERVAIGCDKELEPLRVIIEKGKDG